MKPIRLVFARFVLSTILVLLVCPSPSRPQDTDIKDKPNLLTFSKIDRISDRFTGHGVKVAIIDWQFDLSGTAAKKYIAPTSVVPGREIGELKPWHGEWMAQIVHTIAPKAQIIPIMARDLETHKYQEYLIDGIYYAADHGAAVVTSSMGPLNQTAKLDSAVAYAERHCTIFVNVHPETIRAEGHAARLCENGECNPLILHTGVVSVPDHPAQPEPNRDIYTWPYDLVTVYEDGWGYSNAPPIVAGVIALMKEANPSLTTGQIRSIVVKTAFESDGFRCLDAEAAVNAALLIKEDGTRH